MHLLVSPLLCFSALLKTERQTIEADAVIIVFLPNITLTDSWRDNILINPSGDTKSKMVIITSALELCFVNFWNKLFLKDFFKWSSQVFVKLLCFMILYCTLFYLLTLTDVSGFIYSHKLMTDIND